MVNLRAGAVENERPPIIGLIVINVSEQPRPAARSFIAPRIFMSVGESLVAPIRFGQIHLFTAARGPLHARTHARSGTMDSRRREAARRLLSTRARGGPASVGGFGRMGSGSANESDWKRSPSEIFGRGWTGRSVITVVLRLLGAVSKGSSDVHGVPKEKKKILVATSYLDRGWSKGLFFVVVRDICILISGKIYRQSWD